MELKNSTNPLQRTIRFFRLSALPWDGQDFSDQWGDFNGSIDDLEFTTLK